MGPPPAHLGVTSHAQIEGEASREHMGRRDHLGHQEVGMVHVREGAAASGQGWVRLVERRRDLEEVLPYQAQEGLVRDRAEAAARSVVAGEGQEVLKADGRGEGRVRVLQHLEAGVRGEPGEGEGGAAARCRDEGEGEAKLRAVVRTETATTAMGR